MELDPHELIQVFQQRFPQEFEIAALTLTVQNQQKALEQPVENTVNEVTVAEED